MVMHAVPYATIASWNINLGERGDPRVFIISITHGDPTDQVLSKLRPELSEGDIIMDGGNEHYRNTKRRQKECRDIAADWIGMGVSGGYQSARHGPNLSPGGDNAALEEVMPLLELYAAKDPKSGVPCVSSIGPGGSGHFVKMVHNGIEVGMLSALCEAWGFLNTGMGPDYHQIGQAFQQWNNKGELHGTFLVEIAADVCKARKRDGGYVLDDVLDKVVQDGDASEGTPSWSIAESASRHISCPTLAAGLFFRTALGNRQERLKVAQSVAMPPPRSFQDMMDKDKMVQDLRRVVYCAFWRRTARGWS